MARLRHLAYASPDVRSLALDLLVDLLVHTRYAVFHVMAVPCLVRTGVLSASAVFANFR